MKVYFDDKGILHIDAENNTEMMALQHWRDVAESSDISPEISSIAHLRSELTVSASPVN